MPPCKKNVRLQRWHFFATYSASHLNSLPQESPISHEINWATYCYAKIKYRAARPLLGVQLGQAVRTALREQPGILHRDWLLERVITRNWRCLPAIRVAENYATASIHIYSVDEATQIRHTDRFGPWPCLVNRPNMVMLDRTCSLTRPADIGII